MRKSWATFFPIACPPEPYERLMQMTVGLPLMVYCAERGLVAACKKVSGISFCIASFAVSSKVFSGCCCNVSFDIFLDGDKSSFGLKILFQETVNIKTVRTNESASATGPDHKIPSTPISGHKMNIAGIEKMICFEREIIEASTGRPTDWKKIPAASWKPATGTSKRKTRSVLIANLL